MSKKNFVIITTQRSGSNWLVDLLQSDKNIEMFRELFILNRELPWWNDTRILPFQKFRSDNAQIKRPFLTFKYLNNIEKLYGLDKIIGFKLMYDQIQNAPEIILKLALNRYKIIHLIRENYLDTEISSINAWGKNGNKIVYSKKTIESLKPIAVNTNSLLKRLLFRESQIKRFSSLLRVLPCPVLTITYADLCNRKNNTLRLITNFLNIKELSISHQSQSKKIARGSYEDRIENYSEVKEALVGTKFERFLSE